MGWIGSRTGRSLVVAFGMAAAVAVATPATASAAVVPGELVQIDWLATNGGERGIFRFAFPVTIDEIGVTGPGQTLSVGQHFGFQNWQNGYIGLEIERPTADGPLVARTVFSYFGPDIQYAGCGPINPGPGGMTCRGELFDFVPGKTYTLRVEQMGSNYWQGAIDDGTTGYPRSLGGVQIWNELRLARPFGYQSVGYYGASGSCAEVPRARVRLGTPTSVGPGSGFTGKPVLVAPRRPNLTCFGAVANDVVAVPDGVSVTVGRG
ncbi:hypothetical protein [Prescottella equi]|nr:hypothetical protein [Prescottella equi]GBF17041.1 hypothetical protein Br6_04445 [Rhodococcus sp. Br-6]MBM4518237.1 hypothetical protein [Prescottella equi]MBM4527654.1 hypothetical protein [Prescottella equi]MBM4534950.1 hypothetical protein [Prescottella equi]MBM4537225.1 hypothetical protein [Prescottella equi]